MNQPTTNQPMNSMLEKICNTKDTQHQTPKHSIVGENGKRKCYDSRDCGYKSVVGGCQYCIVVVEKYK